MATAARPDLVLHTVLVDAPLRRPGTTARAGVLARAPRTYETLEEAVLAFHVRPNEPVMDHELLRRVAANSYREDQGTWRPKADPRVFGRIGDAELARCLGAIPGPITQIYGDLSVVVDADSLEFLVEAHPGETELVAIRAGYHHLTFDRAGEVADAIAVTVARHVGPDAEPLPHDAAG